MIYLFNNNEEMIRIIPNSAIKRLYQTQNLTDENYISDRLDVEIQALNDEELSELEYMAIDDIENPQRFHYYFIVKETTEHQMTSLTGVQSGIEELRKTPVYDMRPTNLSPKLIADRLLEGTNWQAGYTTDDVGTISTNFYYTDVFSALKKMCMAFGIEMQFFVEITTNRIGARYIEFRKRTGKSVGKRVVYGHNALKIVKEVEKTNTITALIGRGKGVQVSETDAGNVGYGRKIGIENVEWNTSSGAPVDKPLGQEFVEIPELTLQYGIKNSNGTVRPKIGFVEFQDEENETRLIDRTYDALLELSRPQVLLETSSVYLPDTGIGDTINVVRHDRDLRYQTRVFEITWDRLANKAVDMKLGDRLGESENKRISRISNQVSGNISTELGPTIDELVDRLTTADGKNTNWYTDYDPMENPDTMGLVRVNDNWWQPDSEYEGEFILKQWNGEMWVEILRTSGNQELVRRFEEIEQQAQDLADDIEASDQKADEAKEAAGLAKSASESAEAIAQQAQTEAESAKSNSDEALGKAILAGSDAETAKQDASTAKQNASDALGQAGEAIIKANDAIGKANQIPQDIQNEIESKGLVSGSWVESHVNDVTGEISYALAEVSGSIPTVILGVVWDKSENPILTRTDYVEEYASLTDYLLKTNEIDYSIEGLSGHISRVETNKLDSTEFTSFKTNDYEITVDGFRSSIEHLNGAVPYFTVGIEWDKESNPLAIRTGYAQDSVDALEYERFTADYAIDKDGITSELSALQSGKLDGADFTSFKTGEYTQTVNGLTGRLSNVETTKLDESEFTDFRSNEYEVTVDGFAASLERVEGQIPAVTMGVTWNKQSDPIMVRTGHTEDLANLEEFEIHKADYSQTISGINTSLSSKVNTSDFNSFKTNDYQATVSGIQGSISSLETTKLDGATYSNFLNNQFKATAERAENTYTKVQTDGLLDNYVQTAKYEMDASGFRANLQEVDGKIPGYVMGVSWDKKESPTLYRTADTGGVGDYEFTALLADYEFTKERWSATLTKVENNEYNTVTEFNKLKNSYDSMEQIIGTTNDSVARAVMTSNLWETEVSKVIDDELEQEYKTVTSKVNVVNGVEGINNGEGTGEGRYFYFNNSDGVVEGTLSRNATYTLEFSTQSFDNKGNTITLQVKPYGATEWEPIVTGQMTAGKQISTFTFENNVFASSVSDYRLVISNVNGENVPYIWGFRLYKEVEVEVPIEGTNTGAISSKFTQLYNMINLSVLGKEGALSRIAIGEDGIQIDGKLLHITAKTFIDEAVIKSAMIDTLDANKITTGELNASLIRVVNLDASSITGNEANFIRALFSGTISTLQITGSGVNILDNSGRSSTYLDSSGIEFSRSGVKLGKLEYVTNESNSGDLNNMHGFSMRPNRNSYFGVSYFPSTSATSSIRRFAVSGRTGNVYISGLIKPSEQQIYGIDITWGTIANSGTNVRIMNHNRTGGIQINNGDLSYLSTGGWRSLNDRIT